MTIHITGQSANTAPAATLSSARPIGKFHTPNAIARATSKPASEASHAGRRNTPRATNTVAMGSAATSADRTRLPPTGAKG